MTSKQMIGLLIDINAQTVEMAAELTQIAKEATARLESFSDSNIAEKCGLLTDINLQTYDASKDIIATTSEAGRLISELYLQGRV